MNGSESKVLHLIHLNINSLLPKIDELQYIANSSSAVVVGISKSKLIESIFQLEIQTNNYDLLRRSETETLEVLLAISEVILVTSKSNTFLKKSKIFSLKFFEKPKTKPIVVGVIYRSLSQNSFFEILNKYFPCIDTDAKETNILVILT